MRCAETKKQYRIQSLASERLSRYLLWLHPSYRPDQKRYLWYTWRSCRRNKNWRTARENWNIFLAMSTTISVVPAYFSCHLILKRVDVKAPLIRLFPSVTVRYLKLHKLIKYWNDIKNFAPHTFWRAWLISNRCQKPPKWIFCCAWIFLSILLLKCNSLLLC